MIVRGSLLRRSNAPVLLAGLLSGLGALVLLSLLLHLAGGDRLDAFALPGRFLFTCFLWAAFFVPAYLLAAALLLASPAAPRRALLPLSLLNLPFLTLGLLFQVLLLDPPLASPLAAGILELLGRFPGVLVLVLLTALEALLILRISQSLTPAERGAPDGRRRPSPVERGAAPSPAAAPEGPAFRRGWTPPRTQKASRSPGAVVSPDGEAPESARGARRAPYAPRGAAAPPGGTGAEGTGARGVGGSRGGGGRGAGGTRARPGGGGGHCGGGRGGRRGGRRAGGGRRGAFPAERAGSTGAGEDARAPHEAGSRRLQRAGGGAAEGLRGRRLLGGRRGDPRGPAILMATLEEFKHPGRGHRASARARSSPCSRSCPPPASSSPRSSTSPTTSPCAWPPRSVRIVAPIPGKHAVGIEVPNRQRAIVSFSEIIAELTSSQKHSCEIPVVLGKDIAGEAADHRPHPDAAPADRRRHRLRQVGLRQLDHLLHPLPAARPTR